MIEYIMKKEICWTVHAKYGRGIWRKFSGLSRERRDGWSPYVQVMHHTQASTSSLCPLCCP
jgi:hypothetical protein